jgi:trigger factor
MDEKEFNSEIENELENAKAGDNAEGSEELETEETASEQTEAATEQTDTATEDANEQPRNFATEESQTVETHKKGHGGLIAAIAVLSTLLVACIAFMVMYFAGVFDQRKFTPSSENVDFDYMALPTVSAPEYVDEDGYFDYYAADLSKYVEICDYTKLTVYLEPFSEVTDEVFQEFIDGMLEAAQTLEVVDRAAEMGDTVNISFVGYVDGEAFQGGTAENQPLVLGSSSYIDGFESGLVGTSAGDTVSLNLTFPENYYEELAGKPVVFEVTVNSVSEYVTPELTDEFITANTEFANVEEFLTQARADIEAETLAAYEQAKRLAAWTSFVEHCRYIALPQESVDYYFNYFSSYYAQMANYYYQMLGYDIATVYEMLGVNDEVLRELAREYVCEDLVYYSVISEIEATDEEYQAKLAEYLEQYGVSEEEFFGQYTDEKGLLENVKYNKLIDIILDTAKIEYVEAQTEE